MGLFDEVLNNVGETYKGGKGFTYGTHVVTIGTIEPKQKNTQKVQGAEIIEVVVFDPADTDKTATCTLWFHTEGAAKMSVTKILGLLVHKAGEEKKEAVRELGKKLFTSITDLTKARDVAAKLMAEKLAGQEAYLVAEPQNGYATTSYGDLWHYEAKPQGEPTNDAEKSAKDLGGSVTETDETDIEIPDDL